MILDNQLPGMLGVDVIAKLKAQIRLINLNQNQIHIMEPYFNIISAFITPHYRKHLVSLGIETVYDKPISKEDFLSIL